MTDKLAYLTYKPSKQEREELARALIYYDNKMMYKRLKSGKYKVSCPSCGETYTVSDKEFKQIHASGLCAKCFRKIDHFTKQTELTHVDYVSKDNKGYHIAVLDKLGCKPKVIRCDHVYVDQYPNRYRKDVVRNMYALTTTDTHGWRKIRGYTEYWVYFLHVEGVENQLMNKTESKRELYEGYLLDTMNLKSNQKKLVMDNLFNRDQIGFIKMFNLKKAEDVYKYRAYIRNNQNAWTLRYELNEYYLNYLWRNKIPLVNYVDYIEQCQKLGVKLDKPKDFQRKHNEYSARAMWLAEKANDVKIAKVCKRNKKHAYKSGKVEIHPFESSAEVIECGEKLHNCIGGYASRYANGSTALYYMTEAGKLMVAIEVKGKKLVQAYQKYNTDCTAVQKRHINKWLRANGWTR